MDCATNQTATELGCIPNSPVQFVQFLYNVGLRIITITCFFFLLYGAYVLMTSRADQNQINKGRSYITYSLLGLLLSLFGIFILKLMTVNILKIPGFQ